MKLRPKLLTDALYTLVAPEPFFGKRRSRETVCAAAAQLAVHGGYDELHALAHPALMGSPVVQSAALQAMTAIMSRVPSSEHFWRDEDVRRLGFGWPPSSYRHAAPVVPPWNSETEALLVVLAAAFNGRIREEALRALADAETLSEPVIGVVLFRLDDWVTEVREVATQVAYRIASELNVARLAGWSGEIVALGTRNRAASNPGLIRILERLSEPEGLSALAEALQSERQPLRRAALTLLLKKGAFASNPDIMATGLCSPDALVRHRVMRALLRDGSPDAVSLQVPGLLRDTSPGVRAAALLWLVENTPSTALAALQEALLDPAHAVRAIAIHHVKHRLKLDPAPNYRDAIAGDLRASRTRAALLGLAASSDDFRDAQLISPWTRDQRATVAVAALKALSRWPIGRNVDVFLDAARSANPRLSALATTHLLTEPGLAVSVLEQMERSVLPHHRWNALRLRLRTSDRWRRLELLLQAVAVEADEVVARAASAITPCLRNLYKGYGKPTPDQLDFLQRLMQPAARKLDPELVSKILRHITPA